MFQSVLYKEWLKCNTFWLATFVANAGLMMWIFIDIRHAFMVDHAEMLYYRAAQIGTLYFDDLKYPPLVTGILLALAQFLPEMNKGRLRLVVHLPRRLTPMILSHILVGLFGVAVLLILDATALWLTIDRYFPREFANSALITAAPWLWAGIASYLATSIIILEPNQKRKGFLFAIGLGLLWLFFRSNQYDAYLHTIPVLILLTMLYIPAILFSTYRYRHGSL